MSDSHSGRAGQPLLPELLFAIIGQSALTVAPNFAIKFFNKSGELVFCFTGCRREEA
jgi:hypothetical protein